MVTASSRAGCFHGKAFGLTGELPRRDIEASLKSNGAQVQYSTLQYSERSHGCENKFKCRMLLRLSLLHIYKHWLHQRCSLPVYHAIPYLYYSVGSPYTYELQVGIGCILSLDATYRTTDSLWDIVLTIVMCAVQYSPVAV